MSTDEAPPLGTLRIVLPKGVKAALSGRRLKVTGPKGSLRREFPVEAIAFSFGPEGVELKLLLPPERKKAKALLHTWERHLGNLVSGVTHGFEAKMKSVAAHFPMKLSVKDGTLLIENFLGEKFPRTAALLPGVQATVEGEFVLLRGADIEEVGRCAATIERTTRIRDYDPRVFQDGIYLVERAHPMGN
ncbi:MAG: 50S ribosomal protein L6 [Thermoplasmata archaeon]|nr:50S ribosomal protein L6 [Thermoplasmata archaeon]